MPNLQATLSPPAVITPLPWSRANLPTAVRRLAGVGGVYTRGKRAERLVGVAAPLGLFRDRASPARRADDDEWIN